MFPIHVNSAVGGDVIAFDGREKGFRVSIAKALLFLARERERSIVQRWRQVALFMEQKIKGKGIF